MGESEVLVLCVWGFLFWLCGAGLFWLCGVYGFLFGLCLFVCFLCVCLRP